MIIFVNGQWDDDEDDGKEMRSSGSGSGHQAMPVKNRRCVAVVQRERYTAFGIFLFFFWVLENRYFQLRLVIGEMSMIFLFFLSMVKLYYMIF